MTKDIRLTFWTPSANRSSLINPSFSSLSVCSNQFMHSFINLPNTSILTKPATVEYTGILLINVLSCKSLSITSVLVSDGGRNSNTSRNWDITPFPSGALHKRLTKRGGAIEGLRATIGVKLSEVGIREEVTRRLLTLSLSLSLLHLFLSSQEIPLARYHAHVHTNTHWSRG